MEAITSGPNTAFVDLTNLVSHMDESLSSMKGGDKNVGILEQTLMKKIQRVTPSEAINGISMKVSRQSSTKLFSNSILFHLRLIFDGMVLMDDPGW